MAAKANVVLKDHADADVTFAPRDTSSGVTTYVQTAGVPADEKTLTISMVKKTSGGRKATIKLALPVVQDVVVGGISKPTKVRVAYATLTLDFSEVSTVAERQDMRKALDALMSATVFTALVDNTDPPY
jgi:hypothetical protein